MDYRSTGVNTEEGDSLVKWLKGKAVAREDGDLSRRVVSGIGGFSGLFQAVFPNMKEPCLSVGVDGVGTKIKLAVYFEKYEEIGQDLVAMCVNDVICSGARPLFFMDYYAVGHLEQKPARAFLTGVQKACEKSSCVLLGGETAEMPDCYKNKDFDCAGFAVGVVDRSNIKGAHRVQKGDRLIGVASSGFHSNGFSLLRKVFQKDLAKWEHELIKPTALYAPLVSALFEPVAYQEGVKAVAHITGGGMDNVLRIVPKGLSIRFQPWDMPSPFREVQKRAGLSDQDLLKTLNCGVGMVVVTSPAMFEKAKAIIQATGFKTMDLGMVVAQKNQEPAWFF